MRILFWKDLLCKGTAFPVSPAWREYLGSQAYREDLWERGRRQKEVEENYQRMFQQAAAFGMRFGRQLSASQKRILHEFLALPRRTAAERLLSILKYRYFKSSCLQTLAQCATIPGTALPERKHAPGKNKGEEKWLTGR